VHGHVQWRNQGRKQVSKNNNDALVFCVFSVLMSNPLPIIDELAKRVVGFIQRWLASDNPIVKFIASYGVYVGRMSSLIGRNAFFCCSRLAR